jgi:sigma-B regulation protein RsbU (phosphoserine phosphatase)
MNAVANHDTAALYGSNILVVDDNQFNREILSIFLNNHGWHNVTYAENGEEALAVVASQTTDLILLDLSMPVMDGFSFCKALRALPGHTRTPVIVQTAMVGLEDRKRAFAVGATDFITKPVFQEELIARTRLHLENRIMLQSLSDFHSRISAELDTARTMQMQIIPNEQQLALTLVGLPLEIHAHFQPVDELGGDMWGVRRLSDQHALLYCADFSGHGVASSINTFRLHMMMNSMAPNIGADPAMLLKHLNVELAKTLPRGQYLAIFVAVIDCTHKTIRYAGAAMPDPLLRRVAGNIERLHGAGLPLGVSANAKYTAHEVSFTADDQLIMFSDALLESGNAALNIDHLQLIAELEGTRPTSAHDVTENIFSLFQAVATNHRDDLTILCAQMKG